MCGIFGWIGNIRLEDARNIASLAGERGFHSHAWTSFEGKFFTEKHLGHISQNLDKLPITSNLIGQQRLATFGDVSLENTCPLNDSKWAIVHNGNITNYLDLYKKYGYKPKTRVDSEAVLALISKDIALLTKELNTNYAVALMDNKSLYLLRKGLPLYVLENQNHIQFCSKYFNHAKMIQEEKIYSYDLVEKKN